MASVNRNQVNNNHANCSPNSSEEIESHHGTPATKFSAFSPEDLLEGLKLVSHGIKRDKVPPAFVLTQAQSNFAPRGKGHDSSTAAIHDPFVSAPFLTSTTRSSTDVSKLSPVASVFTPSSVIGSFSSYGTAGSPEQPLSAPTCSNGPSSFGRLGGPSVANAYHEGQACSTSVNGDIELYPVWPSTSSSFINLGRLKLGQFSSDDGTSRSLMISKVPRTVSEIEINAFFSPIAFHSLLHIVQDELVFNGTIYVKFSNINDAFEASKKTRISRVQWNVHHIGPKQFAMKNQPEALKFSPVSMYEGQVLVTATFSETTQQFDAVNIGCLIREVLQNLGDVKAFEATTINALVATYRAEFCDTHDADMVLASVQGFNMGMCTLSIHPYKPDLEGTPQAPSKSPGPLVIGQEDAGLGNAFNNMSIDGHRVTNSLGTSISPSYSSHPSFSTPTSRRFTLCDEYGAQQTPSTVSSYSHGFNGQISRQIPGPSPSWSTVMSTLSSSGVRSPLWSPYTPGAIGQERGTPQIPNARHGSYHPQQGGHAKPGGRSFHEFGSGHHNVVDVDRISQGTDVRTTIMLRNIPNKINQATLKEIVDETGFGKYDFMYLRIDFANNCNVGYAFINFEDPIYIIDFVKSRAGHRWNIYNSDKVAEVSYATIQGRDCLVQKFRNSSVMLEHPSFRPKIFHTGISSLAGTEDTFPGPDNPSKMRRSVENAEHVGLFAPRAGQNFRDEQRRRRSQYDRGTRLAEIEDSYESEQFDHRSDSCFRQPLSPFLKFNGPFHPSFGGPLY